VIEPSNTHGDPARTSRIAAADNRTEIRRPDTAGNASRQPLTGAPCFRAGFGFVVEVVHL
jgi:hypothetical protein